VFAALAVEEKEKDNADTWDDIGWLQNKSFAIAAETEDARYSKFCDVFSDHFKNVSASVVLKIHRVGIVVAFDM